MKGPVIIGLTLALLLPAPAIAKDTAIKRKVMVSTCVKRGLTTSGEPAKPGMAGIAPALKKKLGLEWGDKVWVPGMGWYRIMDFTHSRFKRTLDLYIHKGCSHFREERNVIFLRSK